LADDYLLLPNYFTKMNKEYIEGQKFKKEDYSQKALKKGKYEDCTFSDCIFSNADLSEVDFTECTFEGCNMSMAKLRNTAFKDVQFKNCKLLGLRFDNCNPFLISFNFENCILNFSSFFALKLKNTRFDNCKLEEVEFVEADLTNAVFKNCDLHKAVFDRTKLEGADFRTAFNFSVDPEINTIKKAKFSPQNVVGLLHKYKIIIE
jgi:fluoroquinolone resistance protein